MTWRGRGVVALAAAAAALAVARGASAHQVGLSRGEYAYGGTGFTAEITFARGEIASAVAGLDADGDGRLGAREVEDARAAIERAVVPRLVVSVGGTPCTGALESAKLTEEDGLAVKARFRCPTGSSAHLELLLLDDLSLGHRHIARARGATGDVEQVLYKSQGGFDVPAGAPPPEPTAGANTPSVTEPGPEAPASSGVSPSLVALGAKRFLAGYLHLAFLAGLVVVAASRRAMLAIGAAFAAGHLFGVALAVLGIWAPATRALGPAIAASVVYVGLDGLGRRTGARWPLALAFGGVHGFGLAAALAAAAPSAASLPSAALRFVAGAELAHAAWLGALVALVAWSARRERARVLAPKLACVAVTLAGLVGLARALA